MEVRLLGSVAVVDDGRVVEIRQRRERALLALLALHSGETLAIDRLVDELWGLQAPRTAVASLHNAVSHLRKVVGPGAILTHDPGYVLEATSVSVDVHRFEHLLAESRAARSMQDEATATTILREALGLWHGRALADLAYEPFAQAEIRRLEELRLGALEERIDAELALGRHGDLVPELETLVVQEPLRERLHGQLMLALYRAGRQADALATYRSARATLTDELGIEPGPELKRLQTAILRQDASLLPPGAAVAPAGPTMQLRRLATILVVDALLATDAEEVDPESLHELLERFSSTVETVVGAHGGTPERMAGGAVTVAFGISAAAESPALRAVRAAADIQTAIASLNADADPLARLDARVGIATGEVLVSGAGSPRPLVTGEAIGAAAGLQQAAGPGEIVVGPLTRRLLGAAATVEPLGDVHVQSRARPVPAFRFVGMPTEQPSFASLLDTPFVGRKRELRALRDVLRKARSGAAVRAVCVLGPAGIGKSRLVGELTRGARGFDVVAGRCPSYGQGITYGPLRQVVGHDPEELRTTLGDARAADLLNRLEGPAPEIARAFGHWCEARAARRPLLVVVDDLHWAEPTFLDLLEDVVEHTAGRIAMLCLARDDLLEARPGFLDARPNASRLFLDGLAVGETEALVEELLPGMPVPNDVRTRVLTSAEGNPLFVEQLVALAADGDPRGAGQRLPATIQALLAARLDRLGPGERAVLERAAVIGREFTTTHLTALLDPGAVPTAARHLESLARRGFVQLRAGGDLRFRHVLLQEAAYNATPKRLRASLHERLADRLDGEGAASDELVGYHLERAYRLQTELARPDRAARRLAEDAGTRLGRAGVRAWKRHDAPASVALLSRAVDLLDETDPFKLELLCELGSAFKWTGNDPAAVATLERAGALARERHDDRIRRRAELELAWLRFVGGEAAAEDILASAREAIPVFEAHDDDRGAGYAWIVIGAVHGPIRLRWASCEDAASRALRYYERAGFSPAPCYSLLAAAAMYGPETVDAAIARCSELASSPACDRSAREHMRIMLARLEGMRGDVARAREHLEAARAYFTSEGGLDAPDWTDVSAHVAVLAGEHAAARALLEAASARLEAVGDRAWVASLTAALAEIAYDEGCYAEALERSSAAQSMAPRDDLLAQVQWRRVRAKALARTGKVGEGRRRAREALALLATSDMPNERAQTLLDLAEVLHVAGRHDDARTPAVEAFSLYRQKGSVAYLERARRRLEELEPVTRP